jgi:hypothetical protein
LQQKPDAIIVTIVSEPSKEQTVADIIIGSLGLAGTLLVLALLLGAVTGGVMVLWRKFHPTEWRSMPPVSPSVTDESDPPSSQVR